MRRRPENISSTLKTSFGLLQLNSKANELAKLDDELQKALPTQLKGKCRVANLHVQTSKLILATSSPIWKHQAKFMLETILANLKNTSLLSSIKSIEVITIPDLGVDQQKSKQTTLLRETPSKDSIEQIRSTANTVGSEKLASALNKLATTWESKQKR